MEGLQETINRHTVADEKRFIEDQMLNLEVNDLDVDIKGLAADAGCVLPNAALTRGKMFYIQGHDADSGAERVITVTMTDAEGNTSSQTISGNTASTADGDLLLYSTGHDYKVLSSTTFS